MSLTADGLRRIAKECGNKISDTRIANLLNAVKESNYDDLYQEVWTNGKWPFIREQVVRHNPLDSIQVPSTVRAFAPWKSCHAIFRGLRCRPFVRDEYHIALADIIESRKQGVSVFHRSLSDSTGQQTIQSGNQPDMTDTQNPTPNDEFFPNPFARDHSGPAVTGVSVLGHPGIGKTTFLFFVLLLRLHAKMPTLLMTKPDIVTLFLSGGVFNLPLSDLSLATPIIPQDMWCLIDSNRFVDDVPDYVIDVANFVIQTTSLRSHRLEWLKKIERVYRYVMHPFSLPELIIGWGRGLEESLVDQNMLERRLQDYYSKYTPSARNAWKMVEDPQGFEKLLRQDVEKMKYQDLSDALYRDEFSIMNKEFSHQVFTIKVGEERSDYVIDMQPHIVHLLVDALHTNQKKEAADLFGIFNEHTVTKGIAGRLLDYMMHDLILRKSHWPVRYLRRYRYTATQRYPHLIPGEARDTFVLRTDPCLLGKGGMDQVDADVPSDLESGRLPSPKFREARTECVRQRGVIFRPDSKSEPAFDGFIFPSTEWAIVFQATVAEKHSANPKGFQGLRELGIKKVWYVVIAPQDESIHIPITKTEDDEMIEEAFILGLSEAAIYRVKTPEGLKS